MNTTTVAPLRCARIAPTRVVPTLSEDVVSGLFASPRTLPPKYFYDERGSLLFDRICDVPEYYPTRTESSLLEQVAGEVITAARPQCIVELGSGTSRKTRHLFDACREQRCHPVYAPFDVCDEVLLSTGESLRKEYEWLDVHPMVGDYMAGLGNVPRLADRNLVVFLGGTIGNFEPREACEFLGEVRATMEAGDTLLLGADRVKEPEVLHAAYNDGEGLTAAFNLNMLEVLNRELSADFDPGGFEHYAHFNPLESRIEMHLISMREQRVHLARLERGITFAEGDHILTEISRKFTRAEVEALLRETGFDVIHHFEAEQMKFSLVLARPR